MNPNIPMGQLVGLPCAFYFFGLFLSAILASTVTAADAEAQGSAKNVPPHIVVYLSDNAAGHDFSANPSLSALQDRVPNLFPNKFGMTFTHAVASASGVVLGRRAFESGKVLDDSTTSRTLADYLKLKGYRLLSIGDSVAEHEPGGDFQFDVVASSLDKFDLGNSPKLLSEYLSREIQQDHRPLCLIIRDRNAAEREEQIMVAPSRGSAALLNAFAAVRESLPTKHTIFIATAICGRGMNQGADVAVKCPLNIPLTIVWDGHIPIGRTTEALVSAVDVLPTLVELTGATPPSEIDGRSFASILRGESLEHRDVAFSVIHHPDDLDKYCVHDSRYLYITGHDRPEEAELFDLLSDPKRERNLARDPSMANRCQDMREQLSLWLERHGKPAIPAMTEN